MGKKIIFSVLAICLVAGMVGVGTWAYFTDIETSPENVFQAGTLDLVVNTENPLTSTIFTVGGEEDWVAPCDDGEAIINLANIGSIGGMAYIELLPELNDENTAQEPELAPFVVAPQPYVSASFSADDEFLYMSFDVEEEAETFLHVFIDTEEGGSYIDYPETGTGIWADYMIVDPAAGVPEWGWYLGKWLREAEDGYEGWSQPYDDIRTWNCDGFVAEDSRVEGHTLYEFTIPLGCVEFDPEYGLHVCVHTGAGMGDWVSIEVPSVDVVDDPDDLFDGELAQNLDIVISLDIDGDGLFETTVAEGKLADLWAAGPFEIAVLGGHSDFNINIAWSVDCEVGNIIMSDICAFTIRFTLEQSIPVLTADFRWIPEDPGLGETVQFIDETSGGTAPYSYEWDFNADGDVDSTDASPTWSWAVGGEYPVTLKVTDSADPPATSEVTKTVTVTDAPPRITNISPEPGATPEEATPIYIGQVIPVTADVIDDLGVTMVAYAIDVTTSEEFMAAKVDMPNVGGNTYSADWDTSGLSEGLHWVAVAAVDTIGQFSMCITYVYATTPPAWWTPEAGWWKIPVEAVGTTALAQSATGRAPEDYPPLPEPSESSYELWVSTTVTDGYRALSIPMDSYYSLPSASFDDVTLMAWITTELVMTADGAGKLYVEPGMGDVDVFSVTTEAETVNTFGDGTADPAGSALIELPLMAHTYIQDDTVTYPPEGDGPDPTKPEQWGEPLLDVPLYMYLTTAHTENIVDEPGVWFYGQDPLGADGVPFAEAGGPAPYVGTTGTVVASGAVLDLKVFGVLRVDVQFVAVNEISPVAP
ncbi:MAG: hypothetical protein JRD89_06260 [Deltaproteobacteria bacterium]|nr:hypothetical protein [Deltaproteobacteria bacterium]